MIMKADDGGEENAEFDGNPFDDSDMNPIEPIFWIRPVQLLVDTRRSGHRGPHMLRRRLQSEFARKYQIDK